MKIIPKHIARTKFDIYVFISELGLAWSYSYGSHVYV
jgi:hypothetical protein